MGGSESGKAADAGSDVRSRREFLRGVARGVFVGGLAWVAVSLAVRARWGYSDGRCSGGGICRGCPALDECELPLAASARGTEGGR